MEVGKTLYVHEREKWREWLQQNFDKESEIWLMYPKKASGKPRIVYNDAVEDALCFGWIDSIIKTLDSEHTMQRFSPRRKGSNWSQQNKERVRWLLDHELVHPSLVEEYKEVVKDKFVIPVDIEAMIKKNKKAWENYQKFSESYKRIRLAYIDDARVLPEEFEKRLANFLKKTEEKKLIGYGGIDKYY